MTVPNPTDSCVPSAPVAWAPLLEGAEADRALDAVVMLAKSLQGKLDTVCEVPSLSNGAAGVALLFHQLALVGVPGNWKEERDICLDAAVRGLAEVPLPPGLYAGVAGIAWALARIRPTAPGEEDALDGIDSLILDFVRRQPWREDYDLIIGLVGLGIYGLERRHRPAGESIVRQVVERLEECSESRHGRRTWFTGLELLSTLQREIHPRGKYDLGLAHGVPGVVAFLGRVAEAGLGSPKADALQTEAVEWLRSVRTLDQPFAFPHLMDKAWDKPVAIPLSCRVAWCYGDLGLAAGLLRGGLGAHQSAATELGLEVAALVAARPLEGSQIEEAGICHGAAGCAHIFNRIFQSTGREIFRSTAKRMADEIWNHPDMNQESASLITGCTGVGLVLLGLATSVEPSWDRLLLVDLPMGKL